MAAVYDVGTPVGGERKMRRIGSPYCMQEMDGIVGALDFEEAVPATPIEAQPVTMTALRDLFDEKLKPVTHAVKELQGEMEELKMKVYTNEDEFAKQHREMKDELAHLKTRPQSVASTQQSEDGATFVLGGFRGASCQDELDRWIWRALGDAGAGMPVKTYIKGEFSSFNGVAFAKYPSIVERDATIDAVRKAGLKYAGQEVWAKQDQPLETRALQTILFGVKSMLIEWGFEKKGLWVDLSNMCLARGGEKVLSTSVKDISPVINYGVGWEEYIMPAGLNATMTELIKVATAKLHRASSPTKGVGKGNGKGKQSA